MTLIRWIINSHLWWYNRQWYPSYYNTNIDISYTIFWPNKPKRTFHIPFCVRNLGLVLYLEPKVTTFYVRTALSETAISCRRPSQSIAHCLRNTVIIFDRSIDKSFERYINLKYSKWPKLAANVFCKQQDPGDLVEGTKNEFRSNHHCNWRGL